MLKVFVYGTLKPNETNFAYFCQPYITESQSAYTQGKLYQLPMGYPAMTLETGWVQGFLLTFADAQILQLLDELEDYQEGRSPSENEYQRQTLPIYTSEKVQCDTAWGYVMSPARVNQLGGYPLNRDCWTSRLTL